MVILLIADALPMFQLIVDEAMASIPITLMFIILMSNKERRRNNYSLVWRVVASALASLLKNR